MVGVGESDSHRCSARNAPENNPSEDDGRLYSPVVARNFEPICAALAPRLDAATGTVLEIGAGTGQPAALFSKRFSHLTWLPSDPDPAQLKSIAAWRSALGPPNLAEGIALDATADWPALPPVRAMAPYHAIYASNVVHIAPWTVAEGIVAGAARVLAAGGVLIFYGPFAEGGCHTADSNASFDRALRAKNPAWGVRDLNAITALAKRAGFAPPEIQRMPANNLTVFFDYP